VGSRLVKMSVLGKMSCWETNFATSFVLSATIALTDLTVFVTNALLTHTALDTLCTGVLSVALGWAFDVRIQSLVSDP
jgi:hypothetical protein